MFLFASYLCFFTVGIGIVFIAFLWLQFRKNYPRRFLMLLILAFCGIEFYMYALSSRSILDMTFLYRSAFPWRFSLGPLLWLYVLNMIKPDRGWKKIDLVHFLVPLIVTIILIPDYLLDAEQKRIIIEKFYLQNTVFMQRSTGILPAGFIQPLNIVHELIYCAATIFLLFQYRAKHRSMALSVNREVWKWAGLVAGVTTAFICLQFVQWLTLSIESQFSVFAQIGQSISLIGMKTYLLIRPMLLENMDGVIPDGPTAIEQKETDLLPVIHSSSSRYAQYESVIHDYWNEKKMFLKPDHSIGEMAEDLGMSKSKLSAVFLDLYGKTYTEVVNRYRIHHFLELMKRGDGQNLKLEVLIQNSGFQYRSTFYSAFKKIMGKSPKEILISN